MLSDILVVHKNVWTRNRVLAFNSISTECFIGRKLIISQGGSVAPSHAFQGTIYISPDRVKLGVTIDELFCKWLKIQGTI